MQRINLQSSQLLTWIQPKVFGRRWELVQDGQVVGTLAWTGTFSQKAVAEFAEGSWRFNQPKLFRSDVSIQKSELPGDIAVGKLNWRGNGKVEFTSHKTYQWKKFGFFHSRWEVTDDIGQQVFELRRKSRFFRNEAEVSVSPFVANDPNLPAVLAFIWYLVQIERRHAAVAASV